ncbi:GNAT family N-acetyltransferase [Cohnella herbarum]|uniref:GNAT family N-acetyltransferase n=1 Tax=Cohnella herbarum TaxID=2728023 RepID=A0A7Z2ZP89_9BACL|nr:GNAT family N-acetyltransferase [Cohnella herbarum]QJD87201.1 GNAT family N-acetyltransferase [Cohnella herbarum]
MSERIRNQPDIVLNAKYKYRELCRTNSSIPLFDRDWWLDIVCGGTDNWDVIIVEKGNEVVASLPFYKVKKYGFNLIQMPELTLTLGIWIKYPPNQKYATRLAYERELHLEIIGQMPDVDYSYQHFNRNITNWSTFYWRGFRQTTRYTYVIEDLQDPAAVYANFRENIRSGIEKSQQMLKVIESDDVDQFYEMHSGNFDPKTFPIPYSRETLKRLDKELSKRNLRKILLAVDASGKIHSGVYLVWDSGCAYNLLGGADFTFRNSGPHAMLIWHAIQLMSKENLPFDFYGGMHETVESFFRSFGAKQKPYFQISKTHGKIFKFFYYLKQSII